MNTPDQNKFDLNVRLAALCEEFHIAGATVAVSHQDDVKLAVYGRAATTPDRHATVKTRFEIGSITKVFTATLLVKLASEGFLDLDAPVRNYLPDLKISGAPAPDELTVRTLLDHTAGTEGDIFDNFGDGDDALKRYVEACESVRFIHPPGRMRAYNSTAFSIAGRLIEVLTDQVFETALTEHLIVPMGLQDFGFSHLAVEGDDYAIGQQWSDPLQTYETPNPHRMPRALAPAGAGLAMPARDLLRFGLFHMNNGKTEAGVQIIPEPAVKDMRTPFDHVPPNDAPRLMSWANIETEGRCVSVTQGATIDQNAFLMISPDDQFALSILTNAQGGAGMLFHVLGLELYKDLTGVTITPPEAADLTPATSALKPHQITGRYTNGTILKVAAINDELTVSTQNDARDQSETTSLIALGGRRYGVVPQGANAPVSAIEFLFEAGADKPASHISQAGRLFVRFD